MNRKHVLIDHSVLCQKTPSLYDDFSKWSAETSDTQTFTACKGWLHRSRNRFRLNNIKVTAEVVSTVEEAAATLPAEVKLISVLCNLRFQAPTGGFGTYLPWLGGTTVMLFLQTYTGSSN